MTPTPVTPERPPAWKWTVCGLLLLATMLNYMDRQTLAQLAKPISDEFRLSKEQIGNVEMGFGLAFATGALFFGIIVDRFGIRWLYPLVLIGWSCAGIATAYADAIGSNILDIISTGSESHEDYATSAAYAGFMACRIALGFFEAGHWPCALVTAQRILSREHRSLGNSILQSGAAIGAIITPLIIIGMVPDQRPGEILAPGVWRPPFVVIGVIGMLWAVPWLLMVRSADLVRRDDPVETQVAESGGPPTSFWRPFIVLVIVVLMLNISWQYFRTWMPLFLQEQHGYTLRQTSWFSSAYYIAADLGCISAGFAVTWLIGRGWEVHSARLCTFAICTGLTTLSLAVAFLPAGPLLLGLLLLLGAGALGLFPNYYAFTQELSKTHQGKITGVLGTIAWVGSASLQRFFGRSIDETKSYATGIVIAGLAPLIALAAVALLWPRSKTETSDAV
jgi:ACS family hexuronate transporter-like MFS transporter